MTRFLVGALFASALMRSVAAPAATCPLPGQKPMLIVQMLFGRDVPGRAPVSDAEWETFVDRVITPRFPDGMTAYEGRGQWRDPATKEVAKEPSVVVLIAVAPGPTVAKRLDEIGKAYRAEFRQQSVGILTSRGCGAF